MNKFSSAMRLWQLISPTLPIGAYAYSQGLEYAVDSGWVNDEKAASEWILGQIRNNLAALDLPVFFRLYRAWQEHELEQVRYWNEIILAMRESSELQHEDMQLGNALIRLLPELEVDMPDIGTKQMAFVTAYSYACQHWVIDQQDAAKGLLWSWCENQVAAAIKLVPLGQTAGQRIMSTAIEPVQLAVEKSLMIKDVEIGMSVPGLAIASALHEIQYSRLFRS